MRLRLPYLAAVALSTLAHSAALVLVWWGEHEPPVEPRPTVADSWIGNTIEISTEATAHTELGSDPAASSTGTRSTAGLQAGPSGGSRPREAGKGELTTEPRAVSLVMNDPEQATRPNTGQSTGHLRLSPKRSSLRREPMEEGGSNTAADEDGVAAGSTRSGRVENGSLERAMAEAVQHGSRAAGTYGSVGVDPRERNLMRALARALPVSLRVASNWWTRPEGLLGRIRFDVTLDGEGHIHEMRTPNPSVPVWMKAVIERLGWLLRAGRFSLSATGGSERTERFEMILSLSQSDATEDFGHRGDVVEMGFDAPTGPDAPAKSWIREAGGGRLLGQLTRIGEASGRTE